MVLFEQSSESGREIIKNGWKSAGILKAVSDGLSGMENLDPFHSTDPLLDASIPRPNPNEIINIDNAEYFATYLDGNSSDREYEDESGEDVRNIFDFLEEDDDI